MIKFKILKLPGVWDGWDSPTNVNLCIWMLDGTWGELTVSPSKRRGVNNVGVDGTIPSSTLQSSNVLLV